MIKASELYFHRLFNEFADGLIKVFIPVIIYSRTESIISCILFIVGYYIIQSLFNYLLYKPMTRKPLLFLGLRVFPVLLTQFLLLSEASNEWLIIGFIISYSFSNVFYWTPLNYLFAKAAVKNTGIKTGRFRAASIIGKLLAPVATGYFLTFHDVVYVVVTAITFYFISIIILVIPQSSKKQKVNTSDESRQIDSEEQTKNKAHNHKSSLALFLFTYGLIGIFDTSEIFWSIYIYETSINFLHVGLATTFIQVGVIFSNLISGKVTDKKKWLLPASISIVIFAFTWIIRGATEFVWVYFVISGIAGLLKPIFTVPIFSNFISEANLSQNPQRWIAFREIVIKAGGLALLSAMSFFTGTLAMAFFFSAAICPILLRNIKIIDSRQPHNEIKNGRSVN